MFGRTTLTPAIFFKGPQDSIVVEGSTLAHDVVTQFVGAPHLDDLEEGVFNDRKGQTGGNVTNRGPSFCTCLTFEFIKTVQRELSAAVQRAAWANSRMSYFRPVAKFPEGPTTG